MPKATGGSRPPTSIQSTPSDPGDLFDFTPLDDTTDYLNVLWWGPEGTGKTTDLAMMANMPGDGITLIINAEGGLKKGALRKRGVDIGKIRVWPDKSKGQELSFEGLEDLFFHLETLLTEDPEAVKGVGWDSLTEITQTVLDQQVAKMVKANEKRSRFFTDRDDYRVMGDQIRLLVRRYRDLPCHFGATALVREDTEDGMQVLGPAMSPSLAKDVRGYVDLVLYTKADDLETSEGTVSLFRAATRGTSRFRAKDRFDATPRILYDPTFTRVAAYVNGEITEDEDPVQVEATEYRAAAEKLLAEREQAKQDRKNNIKSGARPSEKASTENQEK